MNPLTPKLVTVIREGYRWPNFRADVLAGLTVAIVALPLAMALGIASGASPDKGLVTAVIAGFLISALGGSRVQIGGPTGAFVVVVFNVIQEHGYDGLLLATLLAGLMLVIAGLARLGQMIKFIPHPVVTGFTAGIAVIIASSQVQDFLGLEIASVPADFVPKWEAYFGALDTLSVATLGVGLGALAIILVLRKVAPKLPGFLFAVVGAALAVALFDLPVDTIGSRFPAIDAGIPAPALPAFTFARITEVLPSAFTIAFLAGIEALLSAVVADGMTGRRHRPDQELIAQGVANLGSSLFGGLPATGAIARTATNIRSGGRTPVAGIMHAVFLLLFVLFGSELMAYVPMPALAAILFMVAWGMSEYERFLALLRLQHGDRVVLLLTFALTVLVDLTVAISVGVVVASLMFVARMSETVMVEDSRRLAESEDTSQREALPAGVEVFRVTGPLFFGVAGELVDALRRLGQTPRVIVLRMEPVPLLDASGASAVREFVGMCMHTGTAVILCGVRPQALELLRRAHVESGRNVRLAYDYDEALETARELLQAA